MIDLAALIERAVEADASDVLLTPGTAPALRAQGALRDLGGAPLTMGETLSLLRRLAPEAVRERLHEEGTCVFAHELDGGARLRFRAFKARGAVSLTLRLVRRAVPTPAELGIERIEPALAYPSGLILLCGRAASGRSTTAASLLEAINASRACHIVTVEDPIEVTFEPRAARITQLEVGRDLKTRAEGIRHAAALGADVIYASELSDASLFEAALDASERGSLVVATLLARDTTAAIDRFVDHVPGRLPYPRGGLLGYHFLVGLAQTLVPVEGGRRPAFEIMIRSLAVEVLIREQKTHQLYSVLQTGLKKGMRTMEYALAQLVLDGAISEETALDHTDDGEALSRALQYLAKRRDATP